MAGQGKLADEIRTGLVIEAPLNTDDMAPAAVSFLDEIWEKKPVRRHVFEFGCLFGAIGLGVAGYRWWHGSPIAEITPLAIAALVFVSMSRVLPIVVWPLWKAWMGFAKVLSLIMTPVVLALLWFGVLAPTSLVLRLIGKRVMDLSFKADVPTYWIDRPEAKHDFKRLERQF